MVCNKQLCVQQATHPPPPMPGVVSRVSQASAAMDDCVDLRLAHHLADLPAGSGALTGQPVQVLQRKRQGLYLQDEYFKTYIIIRRTRGPREAKA